jgi:hypothetical protein
MKMLQHFVWVGILSVFLFSCTKTETLVVDNNTPPPDQTPQSFNREAYLNRVFISLIGRKPTNTEEASAFALIPDAAPTQAQLEALLETVFLNPGYVARSYDNARIDLLNNLDTAEISKTLATFDQIINSTTDPILIDQINREKIRLQEMLTIPADLSNGTLDRRGLHKRCIHNWFYDQINMGTANFVISSFQNFLFRPPTTSEQAQGISMVDGLSGTLFLSAGNSKTDYLTIFFNSQHYAEGQVKDAFRRYLFREPTANELSSYTVELFTDWNYNRLVKKLLSSTEYAYQ